MIITRLALEGVERTEIRIWGKSDHHGMREISGQTILRHLLPPSERNQLVYAQTVLQRPHQKISSKFSTLTVLAELLKIIYSKKTATTFYTGPQIKLKDETINQKVCFKNLHPGIGELIQS